ncbi:MAG: HAD hydrolase-like protein [bacterium]|nr:HAD hydrolase-like protein [bacterium]
MDRQPIASGTVFFDLGGPIVCDSLADGYDQVPLELLREDGLDVTAADLERARRAAVASFAPSFAAAVIWHLVQPDGERFVRLSARCGEHFQSLPTPPLREGIREAARALRQAGFTLRLATKYGPARQVELLRRHRLDGLFAPSPEPPYPKPDVRYYQWLVEVVDPGPGLKVMVGDRLDCDVVPARQAGLRAIRIRVGDHRDQQPRTPGEVPDHDLPDLEGLVEAILALQSEANRAPDAPGQGGPW